MGFWKDNKTDILKGLTSAGLTGAIGLGQSLIGSVFDSMFSSSSQKRQARLQKDIMNYQYELYSPANQVARLRQAGLNPGLMYSGSGMQSGGATGSIGLGSTNTVGGNINPMMLTEMETAQSVQQANRSKANLDNVTSLLREQETITERNIHLQQELDRAKTEEERRAIQSQIDLNNKRSSEIDANIKALQAQANRDNSQATLNKSLTLTEDTMRALDKALKQENIKLTSQQIQESISKEMLNYEEKNLLIEKGFTEVEVRGKLKAEQKQLQDLAAKYRAEVSAIESNTALDATRKALMISEQVRNYGEVANGLIGNIRQIVKDSKEGKSKSDSQITEIVGDLTSDLVIEALLDNAM